MSWIHYADREPTENDSLRGFVLVALKDESIHKDPWNFIDSDAVAWMNPNDLLPLPKRKIRRPPTQADIDKATKPIDCWVKATRHTDWQVRQLIGIARFSDKPFITLGSACGPAFVYSWEEAEIEVEE